MARWKCLVGHYLYGHMPGDEKNEWMREETNRDTGRVARKFMKVPVYIDPKDPSCCNRDGDCIVCHEGRGLPSDIVFEGNPTPDMQPIDDEAKALSDKFAGDYTKMENVEGGKANDVLSRLESVLADTMKSAVSTKNVPNDVLEAMNKRLEELAKQNAELIARLNAQEKPTETQSLRRA